MMDSFRNLPLPSGTSGRLYLHSMPGRHETMDNFMEAAKRVRLDGILCLCGMDEMHAKSPEYARVVGNGSLPCSWKTFPITDFGVPSDEAAFKTFVLDAADVIRSGKTLLLHCGAGIGRTGMTAACILIAFGMLPDQASNVALLAGSGAEMLEQQALVKQFNTRPAPAVIQDRCPKCQETL